MVLEQHLLIFTTLLEVMQMAGEYMVLAQVSYTIEPLLYSEAGEI